DDPDVLDAVPEGGHVRIVGAVEGGELLAHNPLLAGAEIDPVPARFEDGFMVLVRQMWAEPVTGGSLAIGPPLDRREGEVAVEVRDLVRRFGTFTAVDHVSFDVRRGQTFGLLGPNGAGKTTTFRMLCGLLPATSGTLRVAGMDLRRARASARQRIGYVAQKFSLYGQLSVLENLEFFASAYGFRRALHRLLLACRP